MRFNFQAYRQTTDEYGFIRDLKEYQLEKFDEDKKIIPAALTPKGYTRKIKINPSWEYFIAKQVELLSTPETGKSMRKKNRRRTCF